MEGLKPLEAVQAIARRGSFRAAALDLGVSTTALSHTIGRLEASLGVRLFNRTTRSVSLTDAGRDFVARITPALADIQAALNMVRSQRETPAGLLRINASVQGARVLAPIVLRYMDLYLDMQVDLVTEGRLVDIVAEGFDLGLRSADLVPRDMISVPLGPAGQHVVLASPGWLARHPAPVSPADLDPAQCIRVRLPGGAILRWPFEKDGHSLPFEPKGRLTIDEGSVARQAVLAGAGIGYFIEDGLADDIAAGRLVRLLSDWTPQRPGLCLYYPGRRNPSAGFAAFLALVRQKS